MEKHLAVCPYCGAGCKLSLTVKDGLVVDAQGENGITNGMTETTFAPNATCTRGRIVTFLYRAYQGK